MALRLATLTLNLPDGPVEAAVGEATPKQQLECCKLAGTAFAAPFSQAQYVELEDRLSSLALAVHNPTRYWCLFPTNDPDCILATCKTLHRFILVKEGEAAVSEHDAYCIASVVTNPGYRKAGLGSVLLRHVAEWMDGPGAGTASMLYTSIGDVSIEPQGCQPPSDGFQVLCQTGLGATPGLRVHLETCAKCCVW
jgi:GNAT superfamily N-acetyltransferase